MEGRKPKVRNDFSQDYVARIFRIGMRKLIEYDTFETDIQNHKEIQKLGRFEPFGIFDFSFNGDELGEYDWGHMFLFITPNGRIYFHAYRHEYRFERNYCEYDARLDLTYSDGIELEISSRQYLDGHKID